MCKVSCLRQKKNELSLGSALVHSHIQATLCEYQIKLAKLVAKYTQNDAKIVILVSILISTVSFVLS